MIDANEDNCRMKRKVTRNPNFDVSFLQNFLEQNKAQGEKQRQISSSQSSNVVTPSKTDGQYESHYIEDRDEAAGLDLLASAVDSGIHTPSPGEKERKGDTQKSLTEMEQKHDRPSEQEVEDAVDSDGSCDFENSISLAAR